ncbi:MAG: MFS transporter [Deltaproteobacteria bacterium]|nr:MFS transporter [Deltaproteobacteria bacterium]
MLPGAPGPGLGDNVEPTPREPPVALAPSLPPPARLAWTVWGLGAALYLIGFYQRVAPAVMTVELTREFGLTAASLGNLSALCFYSYVAMQVPTGVLADRLGPRLLLAAGACVAGVGSALFALAGSLAWAGVGRLLIGGSVAVAFVGMLKLASRWFAPRQFALATGMALFCGIIGAVFAGVPLRLLVTALGWRPVMLVSAALSLGVGVAIWLVVRDDPEERGYASHAHPATVGAGDRGRGVLAGIGEVLRYRNTWLLLLAPGGIVGCVLTFSGLWGIPFLTTHYGLSPTRAAALTSALLVAWALGGPLFGFASDRWGRRKPLYVLGCALVVACWSLIVLVPALPLPVLVLTLVAAGFASGGMIIGFAFAKESVPSHLAGTISGVVNMGVMAGPMLLQPAVGWVLDRAWDGRTLDGVRVYAWAAYRAGFALMVAWAVLALVLVCLTRETHCRQRP